MKNFIIFNSPGQNFSEAYTQDFKKNLSQFNISDKDIILKSLSDVNATLIDKIKKQYNPQNTALLIFSDAYTSEQENIQKIKVAKYNNGYFFMGGSNTMFDPEVLKLDSKDIEKLIVTIPWFPNQENVQLWQEFIKNSQGNNNNNDELIWYNILSYDSTQIYIEAIKQLLKENKPVNKEEIYTILNNPDFKTTGLRGEISFNKDHDLPNNEDKDRQESFNSLISPNCTVFCRWSSVNKD
jgi:ABC-type branched-subunit amino acid transport system substrate-binding protein